jgi:hypothetical protein
MALSVLGQRIHPGKQLATNQTSLSFVLHPLMSLQFGLCFEALSAPFTLERVLRFIGSKWRWGRFASVYFKVLFQSVLILKWLEAHVADEIVEIAHFAFEYFLLLFSKAL